MEFNLRGVDLNLLPVFEAAYEERSLSRAALRLGMTQPAVSHALNRLRLTFKNDLFIRNPRGMTPTAIAEQIYPRLQEALHSVRGAIAESSGFSPEHSARRFFIAIPHPLGPLIALRLMARLARVAPLFEVSFSTRSRPVELIRSLRDGRIDLAIDWLPSEEVGVRAQVLFTDQLRVLARAGHLLHDCAPVSLAVLQQHDFVGLRPRGTEEDDIQAFHLWRSLGLNMKLEVSELLEILLTLSRSDFLGLMPRSMLRIAEDNFGVREVALTEPLPEEAPIFMFWHERRERDPAHQYLRAQIVQEVQELLADHP